MGSAGFIGESVRPPSRAERRTIRPGQFAAVAAVLVASVVGAILGGQTTTFHFCDAMVVVAVALGPALLVGLSFSLGAVLPAADTLLKRLNLLCGLFFFLIQIPGCYVLWANQAFDRSPAREEVAPVTQTFVRTGKGGSRSFMAEVVTDVASPLGRWSFYGTQPVRLRRAVWERLRPGASSLVLREHRGVFGFAWYEPYPNVSL